MGQHARVRRRKPQRASARWSTRRSRAGSTPGASRRTARWRWCFCATSSRATSIAAARAPSAATPRRARPRASPSRTTIRPPMRATCGCSSSCRSSTARTLADQEFCCALFATLGDEDNDKHANDHRDIVARFGRFPHRNEVLGREQHARGARLPQDREALRAVARPKTALICPLRPYGGGWHAVALRTGR